MGDKLVKRTAVIPMRLPCWAAAVVASTWLNAAARADTVDVLGDLVGYTVVASKTVEAFIDKDKPRKDGFEGCDHDRVIVFTDGTAVVCRSYSYTYIYRPKAVVMAQQVTYQGSKVTALKLVIGDKVYDVAPR